MQYLENSGQKVDVVVFGHSHDLMLRKVPNSEGKYYVNSGRWIGENPYHPAASTFVVVTSRNDADSVQFYEYYRNGTVLKMD